MQENPTSNSEQQYESSEISIVFLFLSYQDAFYFAILDTFGYFIATLL